MRDICKRDDARAPGGTRASKTTVYNCTHCLQEKIRSANDCSFTALGFGAAGLASDFLVYLAANRLQDPAITVRHYLDHLLSVVQSALIHSNGQPDVSPRDNTLADMASPAVPLAGGGRSCGWRSRASVRDRCRSRGPCMREGLAQAPQDRFRQGIRSRCSTRRFAP